MLENEIDDLIKAGWEVVDTDFDPIAFMNWKVKAMACLDGLLGPDHKYTENFKKYVQDCSRNAVLTGGGILSAARERS